MSQQLQKVAPFKPRRAAARSVMSDRNIVERRNTSLKHNDPRRRLTCAHRAYLIIGSGSGFTVNLGSDSLGKSNDFRSAGVEFTSDSGSL